MYILRNISWRIVLRFAWKNVLFFALWSGIVTYLFHHMEHHGRPIAIPFQPLSVIGIAVAFYLSFKNNSSYDRFWEARKIWGAIINYSRTWGNQVMSFVSDPDGKLGEKDALFQIKKRLIYRQIAWIYALNYNLRKRTSFSPDYKGSSKIFFKGEASEAQWQKKVGNMVDTSEYTALKKMANRPTQLIRNQGEDLRRLIEEKGLLNDFRHMEMMRVQEEFYNFQGKCERIKKTPFPRQYAFFSKVFVWIFILLLPFGMVSEFAKMGHARIILTIPFCTLIAWIFYTMEIVGDNSEDPFENYINDVPMTALCETIETDLRQMLGETDLPKATPAEFGVLY